jgi:hypothetical protein
MKKLVEVEYTVKYSKTIEIDVGEETFAKIKDGQTYLPNGFGGFSCKKDDWNDADEDIEELINSTIDYTVIPESDDCVPYYDSVEIVGFWTI